MLIFAVIGYIYMILKISPVPTLLGFILGSMLEDSFRRALVISQGDFYIFYKTNIGVALVIMIAVVLLFGIYRMINTDK
jgi:TctA family transporter